MILVTEAGYHGYVAFSACSTLPLSTSTSSSASAPTRVPPRPTAAQAAIAITRARAAGKRGECIIAIRWSFAPRNHAGSTGGDAFSHLAHDPAKGKTETGAC